MTTVDNNDIEVAMEITRRVKKRFDFKIKKY